MRGVALAFLATAAGAAIAAPTVETAKADSGPSLRPARGGSTLIQGTGGAVKWATPAGLPLYFWAAGKGDDTADPRGPERR